MKPSRMLSMPSRKRVAVESWIRRSAIAPRRSERYRQDMSTVAHTITKATKIRRCALSASHCAKTSSTTMLASAKKPKRCETSKLPRNFEPSIGDGARRLARCTPALTIRPTGPLETSAPRPPAGTRPKTIICSFTRVKRTLWPRRSGSITAKAAATGITA
jgi:hypothetical protein